MGLSAQPASRAARGRWGALAFLLLVASAAAPLAAQAPAVSVRSARLVADLTAGDGTATVTVDYVLTGIDVAGSLATVSVEASALDFGTAFIEGIRAGGAGSPADAARLGLARSVSLPVESGAGVAMVTATYRVAAAAAEVDGSVRGYVPVLGVDRPPEDTSPGLFSAELRLPPDWVVVEGFPTGLAGTDQAGVYRAELAVVPAVVSFRARSDGGWRFGLPHLLDAIAIATLLAFAVIGWRHLGRAQT